MNSKLGITWTVERVSIFINQKVKLSCPCCCCSEQQFMKHIKDIYTRNAVNEQNRSAFSRHGCHCLKILIVCTTSTDKCTKWNTNHKI